MTFPYKHILAKPEQESDKAVILLPGVSGKALSDRYKDLESALNSAGFSFLRFDIWESVEDLQTKTLQEVYQRIDQAVDYMHSKGYGEISFIGKSFGGGVLLTYPSDKISSTILLAPAIGFSEESNLTTSRTRKLGEFEQLDEIRIAKGDLEKITYPTLIFHGTKDNVIALENSQNLVKYLSKGKLEVVEGAGHSYDNEGEMEQVIEKIVGFLQE
tara:strand:- start:473 stop:1117 length:645 start_codon:yes stop_codon:yes gene_type:complete